MRRFRGDLISTSSSVEGEFGYPSPASVEENSDLEEAEIVAH